jgi:6-phosphogluconolactonase (cycloisomerase 2 family)
MIRGITVDPGGFVYVVNEMSNSVLVFGPNQSGNAKPIRVLSGPNTQLNIPIGISYLKGFSLIAVANYQGGDVLEFAANANGNIVPTFTVSSGLFGPADVAR